MKPLHLAPAFALLALVLCLSSRAATPARESVAPVTVFVLRHAEAVEEMTKGGDPVLAPAGEARAAALARLFSKAGVTHLYASPFQRTRSTLAPLAAARELEIEEYPASETGPLAAKLRALPPGAVAVVAGHSNTVPALVAALGGEVTELEEHPRYGATIAHDAFDRLFAITLSPTPEISSKTIELRYGE